MYKLLNRISLFVSLCLGFIVSLSFVSFDSYGGIGGEEVFVSVFWGTIIGLIFKKIFLSSSFIEQRLEFFANSLGKRTLSGNEESPHPGIPSPLGEKEAAINKEVEKEEKYEMLEGEVRLEGEKFGDNYGYQNIAEEISEENKVEEINEEPSKFELAIKAFFAENLLAKLGGILVFLGVLFLLSLVYSAIGPVGKLIIGFAIGFSIYVAGVILDKKDYTNEGRILLGVGILINFLVILSGRYLIGDDISSSNLLSEGTTFLFLIFNTIFAVVSSLVYKSRTLLLFSFIFAFINPLLVGGSSTDPYTLVGYSLIVSFGGLLLSLKQKDLALAIGVFILSNILFLIAPFNSDLHWIVKLFASTIVSIGSIFIVYNLDKNQLGKLFFGSYIFLILLLGSGESFIGETTSFISYMLTILLYFGIGIYYFLRTSMNSLIYLLFSPILIILGIGLTGGLINITLSLIIIVFVYLIGFNFIQSKLPNFLKYAFFIILGIYIFCSNMLISFGFDSISLDLYSFISVLIVSFVFILTSYFLSTKKDLEFLYAIGTIGGIFILAPVIQEEIISSPSGITQFYLSAFAVILFAVSKWTLPFINKNFFQEKNDIKNLIIGTIAGLLFLGYELFVFGTNHFPGISLGFAFVLLAILYFVLAFIGVNKIGIEKVKAKQDLKNSISLYIGSSISLFTFAIALIFSESPSIISAVWLFEATILFFFYNKLKEMKIFAFGIIIFLIGLSKFVLLIDSVSMKEFILLIPFSLIFISFILNIKFLDFVKTGGVRIPHDILHIIGMGVLGILLLEIIPQTGLGWSTLGIALFLGTMSFVYSYYNSIILKTFFIIGLTGFLFLQVGELESVFWKLDNRSLEYLRGLQYISTIIVGIIVFVWNKINSQKSLNIFVNLIFAAYLLIITSLYIYDIFNTTFAVTIYWGVSASILLFNGIAQDRIKLRTIGLYLILLTSGKIFLYDIWFGIDDAISRVVALILIGILFIVISTRYTKKYGNNIAGEFNVGNLINDNKSEETKKSESL